MKTRTKAIIIVLAVLIAVAAIVIGCVLGFKKPQDLPSIDNPPDASDTVDNGDTDNSDKTDDSDDPDDPDDPNDPDAPNDPDDPDDPDNPDPEPINGIYFYGTDDTEVLQGTYFNCFSGVTAVSESGEDLTPLISVSGDFNSAKVGEYTIVYSVTEDDGNSADKERKITVSANSAIGKIIPVPVYTIEDGSDYNIGKGCDITSDYTIDAASKALDGDITTRWESAHGVDNVNLTIDLGASLKINAINIYWETSYAVDYDLMVSDDYLNWVTVEEIAGQTPEREVISGLETYINKYQYESLTARYVRIFCKKRATIYGFSIRELEIFGPSGTVIPTEQYPDLFSAQKEDSPDWAIEDSEWLEYDLGAEKSVDTLRLAFKNYLTPASYRVMYAGTDRQFKQVRILNLPYSGDTFSFALPESTQKLTISARYFRIEMDARRFYVPAYRITETQFRFGEDKIEVSAVTASSALAEHSAEATLDGDDGTYWENDNNNTYQTIDLKQVKPVGRVDLYWYGADGGKGKYYDLLISSDGESWTTVYRQNHGATAKQCVYVYEDARYLRVIDYQSPNSDRFMLEGIVVCSQYPASSGEGKVEYDVSLAFPEEKTIQTENGSYVTGGTQFPSSRLVAYLDDSLRGKPVPSNDWWQGLLVADKGYNMYMNPLTATFLSDGLWLTNPGEGYFSGLVPGNGSQTINVDAHDIAIGYLGLGKNSEVRVTEYSDYGMSAVMTDDKDVDKLTVFLSEGALYAYCIFAEPEKAMLLAENFVCFYDLNGNEILNSTGASYTGDGIVAMVRTHSSYETGIQKYKDASGEHENRKVYEERYYVISVPENTKFELLENHVSVIMTEGNYMSVGAVGQKNAVFENQRSNAEFPEKEVELLHEHGYAFVVDTSCLYSFDKTTNEVETRFRLKTMLMRDGFSQEAYSAYLPHHIAKSDYKQGYVYPSVRGDCRSHTGNLFITKDTFYGLVPTFAEPTDSTFKTSELFSQLLLVYNGNGGDKAPADSNLISGDPYWQGKNLHPMAMAAIAADQIGATDLRDRFLDKIEYILTDWFTYDPIKDASTGAYFYYDSEWGTLYYKNSEFGAGVNLADHYFTYGYYTLASGVLVSFRPQFAEKWGDMIELLIRDYMNPSRDDELFPYMRNFDPFAGHGWAGGYADNNGGNNQESAGEALNSWVGAYLYATAVGNEDIRLAAIYGYTTELNAIKHYWFNYFGDFSESYQYGVVGQVYGASNFYGTFFNGQPLYMYGIHLIPGEEYITSYALNSGERLKLEALIDNMRKEQALWDVPEEQKEIHDWQHIFIPIVAIYDADEAIRWYEDVLRTKGSVGNDSEQFNVYWLIHGLKTAGVRTTDIWAENGASATVYEKNGRYTALCWNPSDNAMEIVFRSKSGVTGSASIPAHSLVYCDPTEKTSEFENYTDIDDFNVENTSDRTNAEITDGKISFGTNGSVSYMLLFGSEQNYYSIKLAGGDAKLFIDENEVPLTAMANGYESQPVILDFKHTVKITGSNVTVTEVGFDRLTLNKTNVAAIVKASSEKDGNSASNAFDGNLSTRWESVHGSDNEWLEIELDELTPVYRMNIYWQTASAKEYKVYFSETGENGDWIEVLHGNFGAGENRIDTINPSIKQAKYIRIEGISRTTDFGYSIYNVELYNFNEPINYKDISGFDMCSPSRIDKAAVTGDKIVLGDEGSIIYHVDFGSESDFYRIKLTGTGTEVKVLVGGNEIPLEKTDDGWMSEPVTLSGRHAVTVNGSNVSLTALRFEKLVLNKCDATAAAVSASSEKDGNSASNTFDGNLSTRWESVHGNDSEWLEIELSELTEIYQMKIYWEGASAKEYKVYFSETGAEDEWTEVFRGSFMQGARTDSVTPAVTQAKYIRIEGISRTTDYGYSIYEIELYNFNNN